MYENIFIYIYHHHHHVALLAQILHNLTRYLFLSSITSDRSSRQHSVSVQNCCKYVLVDHPTLIRPYKGVHRRTSLMSSFLLLQQCPACFVRLIWIVLEIGGGWPYSCCFVGCCFQDLFNMTRSILVQFPSSFFSMLSHDTTAVWKKIAFYSIE